jgi:hypothetical protein
MPLAEEQVCIGSLSALMARGRVSKGVEEMRHQIAGIQETERTSGIRVIFVAAGLIAIIAAVLWFDQGAWAQAPGQQTFPSAQAASDALISALAHNDGQALSRILGPDGKEILSSGDGDQDKADREQCVQKYQEMHRLVTEPDGTTTIYIGAENWPLPIPLVEKNGAWYFDSDAGKNEIRDRTVGENELTVIEVLHELADAEIDYRKQAHTGQDGDQYAQKIASDQGTQDGLYWKAPSGNPQSPMGPAVAAASDEGNSKQSESPGSATSSESSGAPMEEPFQGYYFRILRGQGPDASGGAHSYVDDGKMTRGFAIIAYPAEYGITGVMTFIVGPDGVVYQKDFGQKTNEAAKSVANYDPDSSWQKAE